MPSGPGLGKVAMILPLLASGLTSSSGFSAAIATLAAGAGTTGEASVAATTIESDDANKKRRMDDPPESKREASWGGLCCPRPCAAPDAAAERGDADPLPVR